MKRTPLKRKKSLKSTKMSRVKRGKNAGWWKVRAEVEGRAGSLCEAGVPGVCQIRGHHAHHVLMRSQGGPDEPHNLLWLCGACHRYVHDHPAESYEKGWLRRGAGNTA